MEGIPLHKQMVLLISSHVSAQIGHHHVILDEYTNGDGMPINYSAIVKILLLKIGSDPT
jgi:hypothetical protein